MRSLKRFLKIIGFVCLMLLALAGIGIPVPMYYEDRFDKFNKEQVDDREDEDIKD